MLCATATAKYLSGSAFPLSISQTFTWHCCFYSNARGYIAPRSLGIRDFPILASTWEQFPGPQFVLEGIQKALASKR